MWPNAVSMSLWTSTADTEWHHHSCDVFFFSVPHWCFIFSLSLSRCVIFLDLVFDSGGVSVCGGVWGWGGGGWGHLGSFITWPVLAGRNLCCFCWGFVAAKNNSALGFKTSRGWWWPTWATTHSQAPFSYTEWELQLQILPTRAVCGFVSLCDLGWQKIWKSSHCNAQNSGWSLPTVWLHTGSDSSYIIIPQHCASLLDQMQIFLLH